MNTVFTFAGSTQFAVSSAMFGANDLFKYNFLSGPNDSYPTALELLGATGLRYPGGSMTETDFDVFHPDAPPLGYTSDQPYVGVSEFLEFAETEGRTATIVLPTAKMYSGTLDSDHDAPRSINQIYLKGVVDYVTKLLTHGDTGPDALPDTPLTAFEIGNEYWGSGGMTAKEYGQVVNALTTAIKHVFEEVLGSDAQHPQVLIQMGGPWDPQYTQGLHSSMKWADRVYQSNQDIIDQITNPDAKAVISGLVEHYYYSNKNTVFSQSSDTMNFIDADQRQWAAMGFDDLDLILTEWNVKQDNADQFGLKGASVVIEQMEYMLKLGADGAFSWPVQAGSSTYVGLTHTVDGAPELTPIGAAFQLMSESLIGTHLLAGGITEGPMEVNAYASDTKVVFFVMSRSEAGQHVNLDVLSLVSGYTHVDGVKIGVAAGVAVDDRWSIAELTNYAAGQLGSGSTLEFYLKPFEVMRVEFDIPQVVRFLGTTSGDRFAGGIGNDFLAGVDGDDSLAGGQGRDEMSGGLGRDLLNGWAGDDNIHGNDGNDLLYGQEGNDWINGDNGNDRMSGSTGDDTLLGGMGNDMMDGNEGNDRINGGLGRDVMSGGSGSDTFVFNQPSGPAHDVIADFDPAFDRIAVYHTGFAGMTAGPLAAVAFATNSSGLARDAADRIIYESDTGYLWFDRDGNGYQYERVLIAELAPGLAISAQDFTTY